MSERLTKVKLTNLDKVLFPGPSIKKRQVIEYYIRIAPKVLSILNNRPIVLTRFPNGIGNQSFYEKDAPAGSPDWVETFRTHSGIAGRDINYILCNDLDTLVWLANLAAIEVHMNLFKKDSIENPDLILFDIDPEPPATCEDVVDVAFLVREKLGQLSLRSYVKTSGKTGLHVVVPIAREYTFKQTREFVHQIGKYLARESNTVASESTRAKKPGSVYIDYVQNSLGRTMVCPYSLRATPSATVSMPLEWKDLNKALKPEEFNMFTAIRIKQSPWEDLLENPQRLEWS
jgi:bifunctional non-homologous end joining protein LigD